MARVIDTREMNENVLGKDVPVYMVAVDAETYEEAREKAIAQYRAYLEEKQEQMRQELMQMQQDIPMRQTIPQLFDGLY